MRKINQRRMAIVDGLLRFVRSTSDRNRSRCPECGAGVGRDCTTPFCYGCLGDLPRSHGGGERNRSIRKATKMMRAYTGRRGATDFDETRIADAVADLMHLAESLGIDPHVDVLDRAGNYYDADVTEGGIVLTAVAR